MKMTEIICNNCDKKCEKPTKEVNRQIKKGRVKFYCSLSCSTKDLKTTTQLVKLNCLYCKKEFETTTHKKHKKCCGKSCARKYSQSFVDNKNRSYGIIKYYTENPPNGPIIHDLICCVCNGTFERRCKNTKTCSEECYKKLLSMLATENPNCGGETNYKKYRYKGVWMDSTWERDLAMWMDEKQITWERSRKNHTLWWTDENGKKRRYYPDFYLPLHKLYVDTKNPYLMKVDAYKVSQVKKENKVNIICGNLEDVKKNLTIHWF